MIVQFRRIWHDTILFSFPETIQLGKVVSKNTITHERKAGEFQSIKTCPAHIHLCVTIILTVKINHHTSDGSTDTKEKSKWEFLTCISEGEVDPISPVMINNYISENLYVTTTSLLKNIIKP